MTAGKEQIRGAGTSGVTPGVRETRLTDAVVADVVAPAQALGYVVFDGERAIGEVRSGTFSPTLDTNIGTAYVQTASASKKDLSLDLRGQREAIEIVPLPFYRRAR